VLRSLKASPVNPQAARRDTPVQCAVCGRKVTRASRQQKFCSVRCRQQAHYGKLVAEGRFDPVLGLDTAPPTNPPKNSNSVNGLQAAKSASTLRIYASRRVIEAELIAGRDWAAAVSPDGVVCLVASGLQRRP
jgi:hypothetical protein